MSTDFADVSMVPAAAYSAAQFYVNLQLANCMNNAQSKQKLYADSKRRDFTFTVGDKVLLSTQNLRLKANPAANARKLMPSCPALLAP